MRDLKITAGVTDRTSRAFKAYLSEIAREPMLSPDEEAELARAIHSDGIEAEWARQRLVKANLRFVVSVAKQYQRTTFSLEDLINEGNIGLIKAANHFDETRGFRFISYAVWWIRQSIIEAIGVKSRAVRVPLSAAGTANRIYRVTTNYLQQFGWAPSKEELCDLTGLPPKVIEHGLHAMSHTTSIDTPVTEGGAMMVSDTLVSDSIERPDHEVEQELVRDALKSTISHILDEREAHIIIKSFGLGCEQRTLEEIGADLNLTRERVRQLREKAIQRLRDTKVLNHLLEQLE